MLYLMRRATPAASTGRGKPKVIPKFAEANPQRKITGIILAVAA